jgi:hypothetical protein
MKPIRRELLNGLFVLVLASLIHAAFEAFHLNFDVHLWAIIALGIAMAVGGYVVFESLLAANEREESTRRREEEWLKRVGIPARYDVETIETVIETIKSMSPGSDYTIMFYFGADGGSQFFTERADIRRKELYELIFEQLKRSVMREYKRIICFDNAVLEQCPELKAGILRVGEGPGTIDRMMGEHCRMMMVTKNCSLYVAPAVYRTIVALFGTDKASLAVESADQDAGGRRIAGSLIFSNPPNSEIIEHLRQVERATERRMVAVHKIIFPEDAAPAAELATR